MGGEGAMMAAINSLKGNRNLLSKRKAKGALGGSYANIKLKELPKATPEQLHEIKRRLKKENREAQLKMYAIFLVLFICLMALLLFLTN